MRLALIALAIFAFVQPALSQRADDNALAEAQDAFGMTVGNQSIGLYAPEDVRGFNAIDAGNVRMDGLYFDRQTQLSDHLIDSTAMRVGISSQGYPLPAPTGIADSRLRRPGDSLLISTLLGYGDWDGRSISIDAQLPILHNQLSLGLGGTLGRNQLNYGAGESARDAAVLLRWRPTAQIDIVPFWSRRHFDQEGTGPAIFVADSHLPPRYHRGMYFGQSWTGLTGMGDTFGALADVALSAVWSLKAGLFHSVEATDRSFAELYLDAQPDGLARYVIIADPPQRFASTSGEIRLARAFVAGSSRQSLQLSVRDRDQRRRYGGSDLLELGLSRPGETLPIDEPAFRFGPQTQDQVKQTTLGVAYFARWADRAEIGAGVQKARYRKMTTLPAPQPVLTGQDRPFLFNVGGSVQATRALSFYASYSRGLEEGGVAPSAAANKDSAPPAIKTAQMDGGLRYAFSPNFQVIAGVFEIRKPYYSLDTQSVYRELGDQSHRGVEVSFSGEVASRTSVALGAVFMRPRVEGERVDSGLIGRKPVGQTARTVILNAEYRFTAMEGLSVDSSVVSYGRRMASSDNSLEIPSRVVVGVGARQRFALKKAQAMVHVNVGNVFNNYGWRTNPSGVFEPNAQRGFSVSFAADY